MKYLFTPLLLLGSFAFPFSSRAQAPTRPQVSLLRGPYLQVATSNSMVIRWRTDVLTKGVVRFGTAPGKLDITATDSFLVTEHKVKLRGLSPRTKYYYSVGSWQDTLQGGPGNYFFTLPAPGTEGIYRIAAIGDCGNNSVNQRSVRDQLIHYLGNNYLDSWILLGDNSYSSGRDAEFQSNFFGIYKDNLLPKYPLFPSPGNHDYNDGDRYSETTAQATHDVAYYHNFSMPTEGEAGGLASHNQAFYSFDLGNIHFLSLDSYGLENERYRLYDTLGPQVEWVKKDLETNSNKEWIVAFWHHPPYTMGSHNSDKAEELVHIRENFIRILERNGVDLILCGHSHDYERSGLMKGNYGLEASFNPAVHLLSKSSGLYDGSDNSCPYVKDEASGNQGTVYVVSGSAGQLGGQQTGYPHDAFPHSDATHGGSCMLEVQGNRLDLKWICADGVIRDHFTMMKNVNQKNQITIKKGETAKLTASFTGAYHWSMEGAGANSKSFPGTKSIDVNPSANTVYTVKDSFNCLKDSFEVKVQP
jgi:hypothetical protein